jgi:hypothetical protein
MNCIVARFNAAEENTEALSDYYANRPIAQLPLLWKQALSVDVKRVNLEIHIPPVGQVQSLKADPHKTQMYSHYFPAHAGGDQRITKLKHTRVIATRSEC